MHNLSFSYRLSRPNNGIKIETSQNAKSTKANKDDNSKANGKRLDKKPGGGGDDPRKFEIYFKFQIYFNNIQSHQTLAINRGENLKVRKTKQNRQISQKNYEKFNNFNGIHFFFTQFLSVKVAVPDRIQNEIYRIIEKKYFKNAGNPEYKVILSAALNDAYSKKCMVELFFF